MSVDTSATGRQQVPAAEGRTSWGAGESCEPANQRGGHTASPPSSRAAGDLLQATSDRGQRTSRVVASLIGAIEQRQKDQRQQLATFKGAPAKAAGEGERHELVGPRQNDERNSLESIRSRFSSSSGGGGFAGHEEPTASESGRRRAASADDESGPPTPVQTLADIELGGGKPIAQTSPESVSTNNNNFALVGTRYVNPPQVDEASWRKLTGDVTGDGARRWHSHRNQPISKQPLVALDTDDEPCKARTTPKPDDDNDDDNNDKHVAASDHKKISAARASDQQDDAGGRRGRRPSRASSRGHKRRDSRTNQLGTNSDNSNNMNGSKECNLSPSDDNNTTSGNNGGAAPAHGQRAGGPQASRRGPFPFCGIAASLAGSMFFSCSVLFVKMLPDETSSLAEKNKALFVRGVCLVVLCGVTILIQKSTFVIKRDEILVNVLRAVFGFMGIFGAYVSLKYISLGDSTALVFSSPVWTSILSHFILKEPFRVIILLALPASMLGILLIAHPALIINMDHPAEYYERQPLLPAALTEAPPQLNSTNATAALDGYLMEALNSSLAPLLGANATSLANDSSQLHVPLNSDLDSATMSSEPGDFEHRWPGIVVALLTSLCVSCVYIVLKFRKTTPIQTTTFWLGVTTVLVTSLLMVPLGPGTMPAGAFEWTLLVANGTCSWLGQALVQWALMYEDASVLSVVRTLDVAITFTMSALFLDEEILWTSIVGASIIGLVVVSIVLNNWVQARLQAAARRARLQQEAAELAAREAERLAAKEKQGVELALGLGLTPAGGVSVAA